MYILQLVKAGIKRKLAGLLDLNQQAMQTHAIYNNVIVSRVHMKGNVHCHIKGLKLIYICDRARENLP